MLVQLLPKRLSLRCALAQELQGGFGCAKGPHAVVDAAWPQPTLGYLKSSALTWLERQTSTGGLYASPLTGPAAPSIMAQSEEQASYTKFTPQSWCLFTPRDPS